MINFWIYSKLLGKDAPSVAALAAGHGAVIHSIHQPDCPITNLPRRARMVMMTLDQSRAFQPIAIAVLTISDTRSPRMINRVPYWRAGLLMRGMNW